MRKTWITLLMALVLALGGICGAAAETAVDLEAAIRGVWELETITNLETDGEEGVDDDSIAAAMALIKAFGGSVTMEFSDGKCVMTMGLLGQSQTEETEYKLEGDHMTLGGSEMDVGVSDDTLYLTLEGATLVLTRTGDAAAAEPTAEPATEPSDNPAEGILGVWLITDVVAEDADKGETLPARIKSTFDNGDKLTMTFTADKVSIALNDDDAEEAEYAADAETIIIGDITANYVIDAEGKLYFIEGDDRIVMTLVEAPAASKAEIPEGGYGLDGTWKAVDVQGDVPGADDYRSMLEAGIVITMTFDNGHLSMKAEFMGQEQETDVGDYEQGDGYFKMNGVASYYTIEGDTMTVNEDGLIMTLVRVTE